MYSRLDALKFFKPYKDSVFWKAIFNSFNPNLHVSEEKIVSQACVVNCVTQVFYVWSVAALGKMAINADCCECTVWI